VIEDDGLMTAVVARHLTAPAANTQLPVKLGIDDGAAVQTVRLLEFRNLFTHEVLQLADAALGHIALEAQYKVVDDAIAILHDGSTNLHIATTQLDKLHGIAPRLDTSNSTQLYTLIHLSQF
jgi:hypothetical protein